ncbi:MAG: hypothetical protein JW904_05920 [Spirochaetales bacterium]|nr:hypothetical protein [Spirochaetales bacterium]
MTHRYMSFIMTACLAVLSIIFPGCTNPGGGATNNLTIQLNSSSTVDNLPDGLLDFYPDTAYIQQNGGYYCFNGMSNNTATTPATSARLVYSVNASEAGNYQVRFFYAFGGTQTNLRDAWLIVNGTKVLVDSDEIIEFAYTGSTTVYAYTDAVLVPLIVGDNEIRLVAVNTIGYTRSTPAGPGFMKGLANISACEVSGSLALAAGSGVTSLYTLNTSVKAGSGSIAVDPVQEYYLPGTEVTLTATADSGFVFDTWEGGISSGLSEYSFTINSNVVATARFIPDTAVQPSELIGYGAVQDDEATPYTLTGGLGGTTVYVDNLADLKTYLTSTDPHVVIVNGTITTPDPKVSDSITVASNKTIYGAIPDGGTLTQGHLKNIELKLPGENYIIRNLVFSEVIGCDAPDFGGTGNDNISINGGKHIWIDHCEFYSQLAPAACPDVSGPTEGVADGFIDEYDYKEFYDGQIDISDIAQWITISNCYFHDHWKSLLWGDSDGDTEDAGMRISLHHNYFQNINSRLPLLRHGRAHVYNNYYDGLVDGTPQTDGVDSRCSAVLFIQGNYFLNVKKPVFTSDSTGTYSLLDNTADSCTNSLPSSNAAWTPTYSWSAVLASAIQSGTPTDYAGVGIMTSLP